MSSRSTVRVRAIVAAVLALGLVLAFASAVSAAPVVTIDSGPRGPTNDTMPVFGFTVDSSATAIDCSIDQGLELYLPCSDTFGPLIPLAEGDYTFRVRADDGVDATILTRDFTVDVTRPSLSIDSGPSGPTNDSTPSFGFTAEAGASVECSVDQGPPAYASCTSPYVSAALPDGSYTFRVRATDAAGNQATDSQSFSVDTAAPSLSIDSGPSAPTTDRTPSFGFTAEPGARVECSTDQGTSAYGPCSSGTTHTAAALADGSYTFRVRATDAAGNQAVVTRSFSVDTVDPAVDVVSGPSGPTNDRTPSFGFTAEAGSSVECSIDQGTPVYGPCTGGTTHTAAALVDGSYTFRVRATDRAGNQATDSRAFSVDTVAPSLSISSGPSGPTIDATPLFGFAAEAGATRACSIDQGTPAYGPCTSGTTHLSTRLLDGSYTFRVRVTDGAGNQATASRTFTVDTVDPTVDVVSGPAGPTSDRTPTFQFTAEAEATVQCSIDHGTPAYGACSGATTHTPAAPLSEGSYTFRVRATDRAGNQATASQDFSVDNEAPSLSIDSSPPVRTNNTTPSFGFTAEPGVMVECSIDGDAYGACTSAATYLVGTPLPEGTHEFRVRATDAARNQAVVSHTFTVDTTPPSLSIAFGPSGSTSDSTPLFGFRAEADATVECSIDQGTPAYGPCASATTHAAVAPLADGDYVFRVRATDRAGNPTSAVRPFTVDTVPDPPAPENPRIDPTPPTTPPVAPPVTTPPVTSPPSARQLLSPFPLVRISGTLTSRGARIRLLTVRASPGTLVRVTVRPGCSGRRRSSKQCRVLQAGGTVGPRAVIGFRDLERAYRSGTVIVVRAWRADRIGKYTRFTIMSGKAPRRVDQCLVPEATRGSRCPSA
ncbi:MAG TPA: Ig-like domain-containing protein [Conexibacter sp.]|nr:Ig-like domain-containing protein [Conexibacter sp.]